MSLDGFIAGPNGEFDWIKPDPDFDFGALFKQFDTIVAGRGTFEPMVAAASSSAASPKPAWWTPSRFPFSRWC